MTDRRDTYKYYLIRRGKIVRAGITNDLERREREHQEKFGKNARIVQQGRRTTREAALEWEDEQRKKGKPTGP